MENIITSCHFLQNKNWGGPKIDRSSWNAILHITSEYTLQFTMLRKGRERGRWRWEKGMGSGGHLIVSTIKTPKKSICAAYSTSQFIKRKDTCLLWLYLYILSQPIFSPKGIFIPSPRWCGKCMKDLNRRIWRSFDWVWWHTLSFAYQMSSSPSFSLAESWFISEQQDVQLKKKKNQHSLVSYTTRNGHVTVPPSDMNETVVKWSSSWQTEEHEFYPSPSSCLECRGSARSRAATVR